MTIHQCPKCDLRFNWRTELDDHCRTDHPQFHHDYPVRGVRHLAAETDADAQALADARAETQRPS
jgi:hypothetical protein